MPGEATMVTLSRPDFPSTPRIVAEHDAWIVGRRHTGAAGAHHRLRGRSSKLADIQAHHGGGHQAEIRQHRIAAADARQPKRDMAEVIALGDRLQLRPGIGDGNEVRSRPFVADRSLRALEEILLEDIRLERAAGFARHDEERARRIDLALDRADLRRIGRIEHQQLGMAVLHGRKSPPTLPARGSIRPCRAGATWVKSCCANIVAPGAKARRRSRSALDDAQPAEPFRLVGAGPQARIAAPRAGARCRRAATIRASGDPPFRAPAASLQVWLSSCSPSAYRALAGNRAEQLVERIGEELQRLLRPALSVTASIEMPAPVQRRHDLLALGDILLEARPRTLP